MQHVVFAAGVSAARWEEEIVLQQHPILNTAAGGSHGGDHNMHGYVILVDEIYGRQLRIELESQDNGNGEIE